MIVLVDTPVWIRFLSNRAPYAALAELTLTLAKELNVAYEDDA
jgi:hypothetical protein